MDTTPTKRVTHLLRIASGVRRAERRAGFSDRAGSAG